MILMILVGVLIVAMAFYQVIQGTFSALIMAVLTVVCAILALNYYEPLAGALMSRLGAYAEAVALLALFALPLLILRELFDRFVRGTVLLGVWPDRLGGAAFGVPAAMVMTGMLVLVVMLLPLPASILGYAPYDSTLARQDGGPPRWAVKFTLGLARHVSAGSMGPIGEARTLGEAHPNLLRETFCNRARPAGGRTWAPADALDALEASLIAPPPAAKTPDQYTDEERVRATILADTPARHALLPADETRPTRVLVVRVSVDELARHEKDHWYRLPATHFRLVTGSGQGYYPVGYLTYAGRWRVHTLTDENGLVRIADVVVARPWDPKRGPKKLIVDWVYRLPEEVVEDLDGLIFRRSAFARMPEVIETVPRAFDEKDVRLALSVRAVNEQVELPAPAGGIERIVRPTRLTVRKLLPQEVKIRVPGGGVGQGPAYKAFRTFEVREGRLKAARLSGAPSELIRGPRSGAMNIFELHRPGEKFTVIHVVCEVDKGPAVNEDGKVTPAARALVARMTPRLVMDDRHAEGHRGGYLIYTAADGGRHVEMYYDALKGPDGNLIPADFRDELLNHLGRVRELGFLFVVRAVAERNVVAVDFGAGPAYRFYPPRPLSCAAK